MAESFDQKMLAARPTLHACVKDINELCAKDRNDLSRLTLHTLRESMDGVISSETLVEKYGDLLAGLQFILRGAARAGFTGKELDQRLGAQTDLTDDARAILCQAYDSHRGSMSNGSSDGAAAAVKMLGLGKFVGLDWKVGVGVQSSNCANLNTPFVALNVRISVDGKTETHSVEMSIEEFGNFAVAVGECSKAMESC